MYIFTIDRFLAVETCEPHGKHFFARQVRQPQIRKVRHLPNLHQQVRTTQV